MGDPAKRRRRAKEKAKQARLRRSQSPWQIPPRDADLEWVITANWRDLGLADILIFRAVPGGGFALACFLIDLKCLGLKDAFVRFDVLPSEAKQRFEDATTNSHLIPVAPEFARALIRGGIRWSHKHRFRLPRDMDRAVGMIGGAGDWHEADVSSFGEADGKLHYIGSERGLRQRLIDCTVDEFLDREDVTYTLGPGEDFGGDYEDDAYDDEVIEPAPEASDLMDHVVGKLADDVRAWCVADGQSPNLLLPEAVAVALVATGRLRREEADGIIRPPDADDRSLRELLLDEVMLAPEELWQPLIAALGQVLGYLMSRRAKPVSPSAPRPGASAEEPGMVGAEPRATVDRPSALVDEARVSAGEPRVPVAGPRPRIIDEVRS